MIGDKLIRIYDAVVAIRNAIEAKGGVISAGLETFAAAITALPSPPSAGQIIYGKAEVITITPYDATVKTIGDRDFQSWTHAIGLIIENGFETIEQYAFYQWSAATSLVLPNTLKTIGTYAFSGWASFAGTIIVPDSVTSIGANAFSGNTSMQGIKFGNGVTSLASSVLAASQTLKTIDIGTGVTSIAANMVTQGQQVTQIICRATTPPTLPSNSAFNGVPVSCVIKVPAASVDAYKAATGWSYWSATIQAI